MKTIITACLVLLFHIHGNAQSNFYKIGIGGGFGITQSFTDVAKHSFGMAGYGALDYYFTPFLSFGIEGQKGQVNGGDYYTDYYHRQFINSYTAFTFNGKLALGELIDYNRSNFANTMKGLYVGSGVGMIQNKMTAIVRYHPETDIFYPGKDASTNVIVPMNLGMNFYFPDKFGYTRYILNFNYQSNIVIGEGLDGYDDSSIKFKSSHPDIYTYFSAGVRYQFGTIGLSKKSFN